MGIWDFMGSSADAVKRNAPDAASVKNACRSSYTYGSAVATKIDQAVRIDGLHRLAQWMPDDETQSKIATYTAKFAKNAGLYALHEGYKLIPGGVAFSKIVTKTLNDVEHEKRKSERLMLLEERARSLQKGDRGMIGQAEMHGKVGADAVSGDGLSAVQAVDRCPEDVIRVFMMKEFFGVHFFDDVVVHELGRKKGKKLQ